MKSVYVLALTQFFIEASLLSTLEKNPILTYAYYWDEIVS